MKKTWQLLLTSILAVFLLTACGTTAAPEKPAVDDTSKEETPVVVVEEAFPVTLTDAADNEITIETAPATIISLVPSNTEILFELGLANEVVAVTDNDDFPAEASEKESIGGFELNIEKIISMNPEMVFAHEIAVGTGEGIQQIRDAGIPVFIVKDAKNFEETYATIEIIGKATGKTEEADKIIAEMKAKVDEVVAKVAKVEEKKTVFIETSPAPDIYTPGKNTFTQQMMDLIGADNIATEDGWFVMSPEEIVKQNPDVILVMYSYIETAVEDVYARDGFDTITAIKNKEVVQVDENITSRQGPRLADGLEAFAKAVYPEVFGE
ncbi:ABC transporter substrate-binding protein [Sporosarcina siberiensis]|uniref:ABC transporter substrate-binding protein n=1 Tax=Sporosarcina siberiensis TaxID=1365606 RepID=A0ABW4SLA5_9BACL